MRSSGRIWNAKGAHSYDFNFVKIGENREELGRYSMTAMIMLKASFLIMAGFAAGLSATIAGIASIFSYPALLIIGLNPIDANITNSFSLTLLGLGSSISSKPEWSPHRVNLKKLAPFFLIGGVCGAVLLIHTSPENFKIIVPFLLLASSIAILLPASSRVNSRSRIRLALFTVLAAIIGMYCGYFGAASGGMTIALLMRMYGLTIPVAHALKNVLLSISNGVAAIFFLFSGHIHWLVSIPLAIGFFFGGRTGPKIVRRVRQDYIKYIVAASGTALAIYLLIKR